MTVGKYNSRRRIIRGMASLFVAPAFAGINAASEEKNPRRGNRIKTLDKGNKYKVIIPKRSVESGKNSDIGAAIEYCKENDPYVVKDTPVHYIVSVKKRDVRRMEQRSIPNHVKEARETAVAAARDQHRKHLDSISSRAGGDEE